MSVIMEMAWTNGEAWIKSLPQRLRVRQMKLDGWWGLTVEVNQENRVRAFMTNTPESRRDFAILAVDEDGSVEVVA
jgi:hypothetical protein